MSGLRDAVTGSDACTANGAGPSNPLAGIADTLLGTSSKTRTQLHEVRVSVDAGLLACIPLLHTCAAAAASHGALSTACFER